VIIFHVILLLFVKTVEAERKICFLLPSIFIY